MEGLEGWGSEGRCTTVGMVYRREEVEKGREIKGKVRVEIVGEGRESEGRRILEWRGSKQKERE